MVNANGHARRDALMPALALVASDIDLDDPSCSIGGGLHVAVRHEGAQQLLTMIPVAGRHLLYHGRREAPQMAGA